MPDANLPELSPPDSGQATGENPSDGSQPLTAQKWLLEIERAEKDMQKYLQRARKIMKLYTEQNREDARTDRRYAMLWANTEVLKPAVYARSPKPVVSRRFNDQDPVGRAVSEVLQRALTSTFERSDIDTTLRDVRDDFLLVARGTAWVRYVPQFEPRQFDTEDGQQAIDVLADETLAYDFINWADLIYPMGRRWSELPWVGRRVYLDDATGSARFGKDKWQLIRDKQERPRDDQGRFVPRDKTLTYEIWSKRDDCIIWLAKNSQDFLDKQPPLYDLKDFFPCPKPAFGTLPTDSLYPIPDYVYYQDQADEINELTNKIGALQDALKLTGFYPAGAEGDISTAIERALAPGASNQMIPVPAWSTFTQGGGSKGMIEYLPIDMVQKVLMGCVELRKQLIDDVYQITGISDILRGASAPTETATAQNLKAQWGGIRIRDRQEEMARFARDLARISAEIIAEKFQPETIWRMVGLKYPTIAEQQQAKQQYQALQAQASVQPAPQIAPPPQGAVPGQPPVAAPPQPAPQGLPGAPLNAPAPVSGAPPAVMQQLQKIIDSPTQEAVIELIRNDQVRSYRVDIETDSTVAADEAAEQEGRTKFAQVIGGLMAQSIPIIQAAPELTDTIGETILFVARAFRSGRELEESIEQAVDKIEQRVANMMKQPPPPNPEVIRAQAEGQKAQLAAQTAQHQQQMEVVKTKIDAAERMGRFQLDQQKVNNEAADKQRTHALALAAHNKQMVTDAYEQAQAGQADQMRDSTPLENLGQQFQQLAEMLLNGQQSLQAGQQQLAQALVAIAGEQRQASQQQVQALTVLTQGYGEILAALQAPKRIVRGPDGRAVGVEPARTLN